MFKNKSGENVIYYTIISTFIVVTVLLIRFLFQYVTDRYLSVSANYPARRTVIIDAGHGGKDGGAISLTGTHEKDLNLSIAISSKELLNLLGYDVVLTRDSDIELTHPSGGSRKMQDLKGRLEISHENPDAVFVSIHMNKFPEGKYSGLQVYYSPNDDQSYLLAKEIQKNTVKYIQEDNDRSVKRATDAIYLLHKASSPAVLIECGFLSNEDEAMLLDTEEYRTKLALIISTSISNWHNARS